MLFSVMLAVAFLSVGAFSNVGAELSNFSNSEGKGNLPAGVKLPAAAMCSLVEQSDTMTTAFMATEPCQ